MAAEIKLAVGRADAADRASMRPRRMAAEIADRGSAHGRERAASMRPRRMAAEISQSAALSAPIISELQ